jgi:hypothetical protein
MSNMNSLNIITTDIHDIRNTNIEWKILLIALSVTNTYKSNIQMLRVNSQHLKTELVWYSGHESVKWSDIQTPFEIWTKKSGFWMVEPFKTGLVFEWQN